VSEISLVLDLPNSNKRIYCLLRDIDDAPVVVFVHGLGGNMHEHVHYNGARAAEVGGFAALRVNLYGGEADSRNLMDCSVDTHVDDLRVVLEHLRGQGRRIALIGHSLGGLVVQRTDRNLFDAAVLWDPTDVQTKHFSDWDDATFMDEIGMWVMHWGVDCLVSAELADSWWRGEPDRHDLEHPTKVICAGNNSWLKLACRRYADAQSGPSTLVEIPNADHCFNTEDSAEQLHAETMSWLTQHL
jgi:pimeloyl-ACP methyl ester carboxylesterase